VSAFTKKGRLATALILVIAVSFGLLRTAQCARALRALARAQACADTHRNLGFGAHAIVLMGPSAPQLPRLARGQWLRPGVDGGQGLSDPAVAAAHSWPENGRSLHRRIPDPSPDDPDAA
jgi:hypothetical protein